MDDKPIHNYLQCPVWRSTYFEFVLKKRKEKKKRHITANNCIEGYLCDTSSVVAESW